MNVTQVIQSANQPMSKGKKTSIDENSFSKEFEKFKTTTGKQKQAADAKQSEESETKVTESEEQVVEEEELTTFNLINPFLKLDTESAELSVEGKTFILHMEPSDNETILFTEKQLESIAGQGQLMNVESSEQHSETLKNQVESDLISAIHESGISIDKETLSTLVDEVSKAIEILSQNNSIKPIDQDFTSLVDKALQKTDINAAEAEALQKAVSSVIESAIATEVEIDQTIEVEALQHAKKESSAAKLVTGEKNEAETLNKQVLTGITDTQPSKPVVESTQTFNSDMLSKDLEMLNEAVTENSIVTKDSGQTDTEIDFVSMLRQMSNQAVKGTTVEAPKPQTEATVTVPKEQSIDVIQDMVTSFAENKEGQKTYQTTLHLSPETLGKVKVELTLNEEGLSGKLTFQSDETRKWMEGEWLDLKLPLESKGLTLKSFDFTTSQPAGQQQNGFTFSEQSSQSEQDSSRQSFNNNDGTTTDNNDEQVSETHSTPANGLNVYV